MTPLLAVLPKALLVAFAATILGAAPLLRIARRARFPLRLIPLLGLPGAAACFLVSLVKTPLRAFFVHGVPAHASTSVVLHTAIAADLVNALPEEAARLGAFLAAGWMLVRLLRAGGPCSARDHRAVLIAALCVSAGFAFWENVVYLLDPASGMFLLRVLATFGHLCAGFALGGWVAAGPELPGGRATAIVLGMFNAVGGHAVWDFAPALSSWRPVAVHDGLLGCLAATVVYLLPAILLLRQARRGGLKPSA